MGQGPRNHQVSQPTTAEHSLIHYMQEAFGFLGTLLLTGYGEAEVEQFRSFTVLTNNFGVKTKHSITLRTADSSGLPCQREPVVLLALLKLSLTGNQCSAVPSPTDAVSTLLGWEKSEETDQAISTAIRKYFNLCYIRTDDIAYTFPERSERLMGMYHLIRHCEFGTDACGRDTEDHFEGVAVEFTETLVTEIFERRLFRVNWPATVSLIPVDKV